MGNIDLNNYEQLSVVLQGKTTIPWNSASSDTTTSTTITHGLGYVPLVYAHFSELYSIDATNIGASYFSMPHCTYFNGISGTQVYASTYFLVNTSSVTFYRYQGVSEGAGGGSIEVVYYLLAQLGGAR